MILSVRATKKRVTGERISSRRLLPTNSALDLFAPGSAAAHELLVHKLDLLSNIELGPQSNWLGFCHQFLTVAFIDMIGAENSDSNWHCS